MTAASEPVDKRTAEKVREFIAKPRDEISLSLALDLMALHGTRQGVKHLNGVKSLYIDYRSREVTDLPAWANDLPALTFVDARNARFLDPSPGPDVRWALHAESLLRANLDNSRVEVLRIEGSTPRAVLDGVLRICQDGQLNLRLLSFFVLSPNNSSMERQAQYWPELEWLSRHIDEIIQSQAQLKQLTMIGCPISRIPQTIEHLPALAKLICTGVWPHEIPDSLFTVPLLTHLNLNSNGLQHLPESVRLAKNLTHLMLGGNKFSEVPEGIWHLPNLISLDLGRCPIKAIPQEILKLDRLEHLRLTDGRGRRNVPIELVVPPPEIAVQGVEAIKNYWRQEQEVGFDYLAETKLLIVGEAGAGKTSLSKKILDPAYRLDEREESTEGIDVRAWHFPGVVRLRNQNSERIIQRNFRVNVWDFGGQEIYHSTHQFFLTKRSVYILVCDERKEDTDFQYWLDVVNLLGGDSPLIIVQNRKQGRAQALNLAGLRQAYPHLCGTISLNLADNDGLEDAVFKIRKEVESLPHIGTRLPKTWRDVRVALEGDSRDHISADEFFRICRDNGFTRDNDIRQLGGFLHDLGICLYFQDDALLRKTVILKPEWGTGAVYRVLDDDEVVTKLGVFTKDDLHRIWHEQAFAGMHAELVQLMVKFALCFAVEAEPQKYVAPQLLSPEQPAYEWGAGDNLVLRYEYDVMPKGIIRRLIVALHDLIEGALVWRTGVVLSHGTARAEIIEQYHRRRLCIRLMGEDPRILLAMIDRQLALIHRSYSEIRFDKLRPCHCPACATSTEPAMFLISELEDFARAGDHIQCRVSRKLLDPVPLLAELSSDRIWRTDRVSAEPPTSPPVPVPEVFVSYKWGGAAESLVNDVQERLEALGVAVVRDKTAMSYGDSIREFMRRIGAGKAVIVVLDKGYLESENCMFELTEIAGRAEFRDRVFPVVLPDATIFKALDRLHYIAYWEQQKADLEAAMRRVGQENLQGIRDDLDLYERIRNTMAGILDVLRDMNAPHGVAEQLAGAIVERLERDQRMAKLA